MNGRLVISIHDVAPATIHETVALREMVRTIAGDVPVSLLVVPHYHGSGWDTSSTTWLRSMAHSGDEVVIHGLVHMGRDGRDGPEFAPRDSLGDTIARLSLAISEVRDLGVHATGFLAPCYAHPPVLDRALRTSGLEWWATRNHLVTHGARTDLRSLGLGASTLTRRIASPWVAAGAVTALSTADRVRLDLHPADLRHERLTLAVPRILEALMRQRRHVTTHERLVRQETRVPVPR